MKFSNSKKQLAKIISENGGWRDGAKFSAQDGDGTGSIDFFKSKPHYCAGDKYWRGKYDVGYRIGKSDVTIKNYHQTVLSRDEYFHLYPAPDADGWIEWEGGECPVNGDELVVCKVRSGREWRDGKAIMAKVLRWRHTGGIADIIAYRLHKQEPAKPESDQVEEAKPTIEQLAAEYRNAKDYAERKQQEADEAKAEAEAKLAELVSAGKAVGLVVGVVGPEPEPEPELVITDWRQWRVGDVVSWSLLNHAGEFEIISVHHDPSRNIGDFEVEDKQGGVYRVYGNECRFIRRP